MPILLLDKRLQNCSDSELNAVHARLVTVLYRFGWYDEATTPLSAKLEWEALQREYARRGCQLRFDLS
jgi:uncharacterized protein YcfL